MEEKINLRLFEDFFESSSPANYAKMLINMKNADENKEFVEEIKGNIRFKKQNKRNEWSKKIDKNADETLEFIDYKILDYNKDAQKNFQHTSKVD